MLKLDDQGRADQQRGDEDAPGGETAARDLATTRRALLTGGAVVAGAAVATLATTEQAAAADVVLGGSEDTQELRRSYRRLSGLSSAPSRRSAPRP